MFTYPTNCDQVRMLAGTPLPSGTYTVYMTNKYYYTTRGFGFSPSSQHCEMDGDISAARGTGDVIGVNALQNTTTPQEHVRDCADIYMRGIDEDVLPPSGVYMIYSPWWYYNTLMGFTLTPMGVYCDMRRNGGGWTVFQRRQDGGTSFNRYWVDYREGFGDLYGDFWLGNALLSDVTTLRVNVLDVSLTSDDGVDTSARYTPFSVLSEGYRFQLLLGCHHGNDQGGDGLQLSNGAYFTTRDTDWDTNEEANCASLLSGGWWYAGTRCADSTLNGEFGTRTLQGIWWGSARSGSSQVRRPYKGRTQMAFRPLIMDN